MKGARWKDSWFFDGYEQVRHRDETGTMRSELVYKGVWYGFPGGAAELRTRKVQTLVLSLVCLAAYLAAQFRPSLGGMILWTAIPSLWALVPMVFILVAYINFLPSKEKWETRVYYAGYRRLLRYSIATLVLLALWVAAEVAFLAFNPGLVREELWYFLCALISLAAMVAQVIQIRRHPAIVVQGPVIE